MRQWEEVINPETGDTTKTNYFDLDGNPKVTTSTYNNYWVKEAALKRNGQYKDGWLDQFTKDDSSLSDGFSKWSEDVSKGVQDLANQWKDFISGGSLGIKKRPIQDAPARPESSQPSEPHPSPSPSTPTPTGNWDFLPEYNPSDSAPKLSPTEHTNSPAEQEATQSDAMPLAPPEPLRASSQDGFDQVPNVRELAAQKYARVDHNLNTGNLIMRDLHGNILGVIQKGDLGLKALDMQDRMEKFSQMSADDLKRAMRDFQGEEDRAQNDMIGTASEIHIAQQKLGNLEEQKANARRLGFDTSDIDNKIKEVEGEIKSAEHRVQDAGDRAENARRNMQAAGQRLSELKPLKTQSSRSKTDHTAPETTRDEVFGQAQSDLLEKRFDEATRRREKEQSPAEEESGKSPPEAESTQPSTPPSIDIHGTDWVTRPLPAKENERSHFDTFDALQTGGVQMLEPAGLTPTTTFDSSPQGRDIGVGSGTLPTDSNPKTASPECEHK